MSRESYVGRIGSPEDLVMRNLALSEHRPVWGSATGNMKSRKSILIWHAPVRGSILSLHRVCASISAGSDLK